jgi:hypothetical protein
MRNYYLSNSKNISKLPTFLPHGSILNWNAYSIEDIDLELMKLTVPRFVEIEKDVAIFGFKNWGDPRTEIKVYASSLEEDNSFEDINILDYAPEGEELTPLSKIKIPMTEKRTGVVISLMKIIAKLLIEDEYDIRYDNLIARTSKLERESWYYQLNDSEFLSSLASIKGVGVEDFSSVVSSKNKEYNDELKRLYIECQELKQKFYNCSSIKELNILFEDYFNVPMHEDQALEIGRATLHEDSPIERDPVGYGLNF